MSNITHSDIERMSKDLLPKTCPRCGKVYSDYPALSRHAEVNICSLCGTEEAMFDFINYEMPYEDWYVYKEGIKWKTRC